MATINELVQQLELFSAELIELRPPINEAKIGEFEGKFALTLPVDYKAFLKLHNGLSLIGLIIYGIDDESVRFSLEDAYNFEHHQVDNPIPEYLVPFSPDGGGNHYCFDLRTHNLESCEIIFWQHDLMYNDDNKPEVVNESFADWMKEVVIDWTLEDYDYSGKRQ